MRSIAGSKRILGRFRYGKVLFGLLIRNHHLAMVLSHRLTIAVQVMPASFRLKTLKPRH